RLFDENELKRVTAGAVLFEAPIAPQKKQQPKPAKRQEAPPEKEVSRAQASAPKKAEIEPGLLAGLDDEQRAAAETTGPLLILAGPGAGKTRTLTQRIAYRIAAHEVPAANCLAVTFTRRAAAEMRERLAALLPADADKVAVHTFHSLGLSILREHPQAAG